MDYTLITAKFHGPDMVIKGHLVAAGARLPQHTS